MKRILSLLIALLAVSGKAPADAQIGDWIGQYTMNHDGHVGQLVIGATKKKCAKAPWGFLWIRYTDSKGASSSGYVSEINQNGQRMVFLIDFPGNRQQFEAYLFSWDKNLMAGTTVWNGRTFGFFASRNAPKAVDVPAPPRLPVAGTGTLHRVIKSDGTVETRFADGTITQTHGCGGTTIFPDGRSMSSSCAEAPAPTPPALPPDAVTVTWLEDHAGNLEGVIRSYFANDQSSLDNYFRNYETDSMSLYGKIDKRTRMILILSGGQ